jgi:hypothetical protein
MLCLTLLAVLVTVGCEGGSGGGVDGVKVSMDVGNIKWNGVSNYFAIPVTGTPTSVPGSSVLYKVELLSREGYSYGSRVLGWDKGEAATAQTVIFHVSSGDQSASHVYRQLRSDYQSGDFTALETDASTLLKVEVSKV